ncbi:MAG: hypothetical protein RR753_04800 [Raoultibacter sp.]
MMLFILTGEVQIGKTRWLQALVRDLRAASVASYGVVAPGVWKPLVRGESVREKLGIDNVLLPQEELIHFARRRDLAQREGVFDATSQSARAGLQWEIDDAAIDAVNAHFAALALRARDVSQEDGICGGEQSGGADVMASSSSVPRVASAGFLVVDELGRLELLGEGGLVQATALLDRGPTPLAAHALVIVRDSLFEVAHKRFSTQWSDICRIAPDDGAREKILSLY